MTHPKKRLCEPGRLYCSRIRLTLIIPRSPESTRLTKDDIPLVMTSLRAVVSRVGADLRRVVVVADRTQSSLAWQCTFGGPSVIRGIALTDGWIADAAIHGVEGAGHSVLLLDQSQGAQANALRVLSGKSLTDAGFWVPRPPASVDRRWQQRARIAVYRRLDFPDAIILIHQNCGAATPGIFSARCFLYTPAVVPWLPRRSRVSSGNAPRCCQYEAFRIGRHDVLCSRFREHFTLFRSSGRPDEQFRY